MSELKPCPFCGGPAKCVKVRMVAGPDTDGARCGSFGLPKRDGTRGCVLGFHKTEFTVEQWNSRAPSLLDGVPSGWELTSLTSHGGTSGYRAILRGGHYGSWTWAEGTGPTPEAALKDAAARAGR